jgi:hypothetical protein
MQITISPWLIRQREAKKLATARTMSRRHQLTPTSPFRAILKAYKGVPSWAIKQGLIKVRTF